MRMNLLRVGLMGWLSAGAIASSALILHAQAPSSNLPPGISQADHNRHHPQQNSALTSAQNQASPMDQHFIEMMIPHHEDAIAMADLALTRAQHPEIKKLAQAIQRDQAREIHQMRTWYQQWFGQAVPANSTMGSMMMGGQGMMHNSTMMQSSGQNRDQTSGMMCSNNSAAQKPCEWMSRPNPSGMQRMDLNVLKNAKDFDREFIRQMIPHHQMAVRMSQMLQQRTTQPQMKALAQSIIQSQSTEINQMQQWDRVWSRPQTTPRSKT